MPKTTDTSPANIARVLRALLYEAGRSTPAFRNARDMLTALDVQVRDAVLAYPDASSISTDARHLSTGQEQYLNDLQEHAPLAVACDACRVPPSIQCNTPDGLVMVGYHQSRIDKALATKSAP